MSTFPLSPNARVLWCLRRRAADVRCIMYSAGLPVEIQIFQDRDLVLAELFQEESLALSWADQYAKRLRQHGWSDSAP